MEEPKLLEIKTITIDNKKFQMHPLPAIRALKLDKKIVSLLLPVLSGVDGFSLDAEINLSTSITALSNSLMNMKENDFIELVKDMLSTIVYLPDGNVPIEIQSDEDINTIFQGSIITIYKLIWEVMRYNSFSPFVVVAGGNGMIQTFFSAKAKTEIKEDGKKLEK